MSGPRSLPAAAAWAALLATPVSAQTARFSDLHRMLPWELGAFPFPPTSSFAVAAGDVDGDGDLDLLVGYDGPGPTSSAPDGRQNRLFLNGGTGGFADAAANLPQILDSTRALALGDVDGDGDLDALVGNGGYAYFQANGLLLNDGAGAFSISPEPLPGGASFTSSLGLGDIDGDGDLDAMVAGWSPGSTQTILLLSNNGDGVFSDVSSQAPVATIGVYAVALGDLDGDGDLDAFLGSAADRPLLNDGTGVFALGTPPSSPPSGYTTAVTLGDFDGDGDLDAASAREVGCSFVSCLGAQNRLYLNGGSANFTDFTVWLPAEVDRTTSVARGDVDADGDLDLLFGNIGTCSVNSGCGYGENRLYLNGGYGFFGDASSQLPELDEWTHAAVLADVDGDGDLDSVLATKGDEGLANRLLLNDGAGVFSDSTGQSPSSPFSSTTVAVSLGDLDGDGDLDALVSRGSLTEYAYPQGNGVYLNDGSGRLLDAPAQPFDSGSGYFHLALGDVDGDGDLDAMKVIGAYPYPGSPLLSLNDGAAVFTPSTSQPPILGAFMSVGLGDLDGDGDLDALFGMGAYTATLNNAHRVYLNNGAGAFAYLPSAAPANLFTVRAVALGDVDGDGDLDAILGTAGPCTSSVCPGQVDQLILNNGSGVFAYASFGQFPAPADPTFAVALGDVDGDGDLDALAGNGGFPTSFPDRLYVNDGSGVFANASGQLPADNDITSAVAFADAEGDGDLDALVGAFPQNRFLLNGGSGVFTDASAGLGPVRGSALDVAFGDLDGDGDPDSVLADSGELRVLSNLTRQLAWRALPRIGKPITFDIHGPVWGAWFLVASLGTGNTPLPPLGVMRLDLATLIPLTGGLLDAQGQVAVTYQVPAMPALVGQSLNWQAVVVGPARLTNLEVTTLTNL